jgi:hypothetical protein
MIARQAFLLLQPLHQPLPVSSHSLWLQDCPACLRHTICIISSFMEFYIFPLSLFSFCPADSFSTLLYYGCFFCFFFKSACYFEFFVDGSKYV